MHRILAYLTDGSTISRLSEWVESGGFDLQIVECFEDALAAFAAGTFDTFVVDEAAQALEQQRREALWEAVSAEARVFIVGEADLRELDDAQRVGDVEGFIEAVASDSLTSDAQAFDAMTDRPESGKYFVTDTQGGPCLGGPDSRAHVQTDGLHREISHLDASQMGAPWVLYVGPADAFRRSLVQAARRENIELSVADHPRELNLSEGEAPLDLVILAVEDNLGELRRAIRYLRRRQPENSFEVLLLGDAQQPVTGGLARSLGADEVIDRSADPIEVLQRARGERATADRVGMLVFSSNSERFPLFEAALAREPVDVMFASEIDNAEDAFEMWSPHLVLVDRTETAESSRALLDHLRRTAPFASTRYVGIVGPDDTLGGREEFFDAVLSAPLSWADIRRVVRRQIAHVSYGKMRLERDSLTGVRSTLVLAEHLQTCLDEAHQHGDSVMLTGLDVDGLEELNARYGRAVGDAVLRSLADSLYLAAESRENIYRTPADEFFVLQRVDSKDWYGARDRLDTAMRVFQKQTFRAPDGRGTYATATGGMVVVPPVPVSAEVCLEKCWIVLDRAMRTRRDRLLVAQLDPSMLPKRESVRDRADELE